MKQLEKPLMLAVLGINFVVGGLLVLGLGAASFFMGGKTGELDGIEDEILRDES